MVGSETHPIFNMAEHDEDSALRTIESERDFYFEKLRGIEVMLQVYRKREEEEKGSGDVEGVMDKIFTVMYATMEDNVLVDDDGNVSFCFYALLLITTLCSRKKYTQ